MVKDAEANAASDKERSEQIDLKNQSDALIYKTRKQLEELGDKVEAGEKIKLEEMYLIVYMMFFHLRLSCMINISKKIATCLTFFLFIPACSQILETVELGALS